MSGSTFDQEVSQASLAKPPRKHPKDIDAEKCLLGSLLKNDQALTLISEDGGLVSEDFYDEANRIIYNTIVKISTEDKPIHPVVLIDELETAGLLEKVGGRSYIYEAYAIGSTTSEVLAFANIVRNKSKRRALIEVSEHIIDMCQHPDNRTIKEILDEASGQVFKLAESAHKTNEGPQPVINRAVSLLVEIQEKVNHPTGMSGIPTGFYELDELTQGLQPGSLNIIAARPSVGKTTFAMNIVTNIALNKNINKPALVFSLEMPTEQLLLRMLSTFGRISMNNLKSGQVDNFQWNEIVKNIKMLAFKDENGNQADKIFIDDDGDITPLEIRAHARKLALEYGGLSVIMIDYIQLMRPQTKAANRTLEIAEISRSLKMLAKELNIPVIALAQLNREVDNRKDHRPLNSDLRESGSLEQDADMIMFLQREAIYQKTPENANQATLIIGKNRNGATADIDLTFIGEYSAFYDKGYADANHLTEPSYQPEYNA